MIWNLRRFTWLPVPVLLMAICILHLVDPQIVHESQSLLLLLNFLFLTLAFGLVAALVARSFLARPSLSLLPFGCGSLLWCGASIFSPLVMNREPNTAITLYNILVCLAALCHLAGALLALRPARNISRPGLMLSAAYALAGLLVWLVVQASLQDSLPVFFVPGQGGTPVRQAVLAAAVAMFVGAAALLRFAHRGKTTLFVHWYCLALLLMATGLIGVMMQTVNGSVQNWTARAAQMLGGMYMLLAALGTLRESGGWISFNAETWDFQLMGMPPKWLARLPVGWHYALAAAIAVAATALRWVLVPWLGTINPYDIWFIGAAVTTAFAGLGPGLLFLILGMIGVEMFVLQDLPLLTPPTMARVAFTLFVGGLIVFLMYATRGAANQARKNAERLATFAAATFEGIAESEAGVILDCNEQFARLLDYTVEELQGMEIAGLIAPDDRDRVLANIKQNRESAIEHDMLRRDGTRVTVEAHGRPLGRGRQTIIHDITPRKQAEEALRESEVRLAAILEQLPVGLGVIETCGRYTLRNTLMSKYVGNAIPSHDPQQRNRWRAIDADGHPIPPHQWPGAQALRGKSTTGFEMVYSDDAGREHWRSVSGVPFLSKSGEIAGAISVVQDITERKQAEEMIRTNQQLYAAIHDHAPFAIALIEYPGGTITNVNAAYEKFFECPREEAIGKTALELDLAPDPDSRARMHKKIQEQGYVRDWEMAYRTRSGKDRLGSFSFDLVEIGGRQYHLGTAIDITERKQAEEVLKTLNEELERRVEYRTRELQETQTQFLHMEKLTAIGKLSASIAHEFNSPLQAVMTVLKGFRWNTTFDATECKMLELAVGECERMSNLIRNLQDFYRPTSGTMVPLNLHATIDSLLMLYKSDHHRKNIKVETHWEEMLPRVMAIPDQIKQVFINLLNNAAEA